MLLGYNTNGFGYHRLEDAIDIIADMGYSAIGLTVDYQTVNPLAMDADRQIAWLEGVIHPRDLGLIVETGARFLLDPRRKHWPTLLSKTDEQRLRRIVFLERCAALAARFEPRVLSFWSGKPEPDTPARETQKRLVAGGRRVCDYCAEVGVTAAFEPEPGMFIETLAQYEKLRDEIGAANLKLTLDVGHVICTGEMTPQEAMRRFAPEIANIHLEDMVRGRHDHIMFGEGEIDLRAFFAAYRDNGCTAPVVVELSRHSHDAVETAAKAWQAITEALENL